MSRIPARPFVPLTDPEHFWKKVAVGAPDECWNWQAYITPAGYGQYKRNWGAHRIAYQLTHGQVPLDLTIDHLCRNRACVNPAHLELVTHKVNVRRGIGSGFYVNERKTHCPRGHLYDETNTYVEGGRRHCRTCDAVVKIAYKERTKPRCAYCGLPCRRGIHSARKLERGPRGELAHPGCLEDEGWQTYLEGAS